MSASQGCNDEKEVVERFKEALGQRVGYDRYRRWFQLGVEFSIPALRGRDGADEATPLTLVAEVTGPFALARLENNFLSQMRGAAMQAAGRAMKVQLQLSQAPDTQQEFFEQIEPAEDAATSASDEASHRQSEPRRGPSRSPQDSGSPKRTASSGSSRHRPSRQSKTQAIAQLVTRSVADQGAKRAKPSGDGGDQPNGPGRTRSKAASTGSVHHDQATDNRSSIHRRTEKPAGNEDSRDPQTGRGPTMSIESFVSGTCNEMAQMAAKMACETPAVANPLFLYGPTGTGKTHLLHGIAHFFRSRLRMRRVIQLTAEQFTNDFIASVRGTGITSFRKRYREVDALLIDDIQFVGSKHATRSELLYTIEELSRRNCPIVFTGSEAPGDIGGLNSELAGRMAAGLVCPLQKLDQSTRLEILKRLTAERCQLSVPETFLEQVSQLVAGDGRVLSGLVNNLNLLQRMHGRMPTMDEFRALGGDALRGAQPVATLSVIEAAVCDAFRLPLESLREKKQTRFVAHARMVAMYLARQLTPAAYAEIAQHFGGKSHSTAISAERNVKKWIQEGTSLGRGGTAMPVRETLDRIEHQLRSVS